MNLFNPRRSIFISAILAILSVFFLFQLKFSFDFEQFFPAGDPDLDFFKEFIADFETDDNFLLVGIRREEGVFEQQFLEDFHAFTLEARKLPHVLESQSLTKFAYPLKTPFAVTTIPAIHINDPSKYEKDKKRILNDERFVHNLISKDATTLVINLKIIDSIDLGDAKELMAALNILIDTYDFKEYHYIGRPYFQEELVAMQQREIIVSALVSGVLVTIIMFLIFQKIGGILVALLSIALGMLLFMGLLGAWGRELNAIAALYPVLMIIVGTSDVIHIMSKYIDEMRKGVPKKEAIATTIREIGMATLLTSATTAIGFASLVTSRIIPIRDFGINAAIGVLIAFLTVIFFTTALLSYFTPEQIIKQRKGEDFWRKWMDSFYHFTLNYPRQIVIGAFVVLGIVFYGISQITTNYNIVNNMPTGEKLTEDFLFFEKEFAGFRPFEIAVFIEEGYTASDYVVLKEIDKVEQYLKNYEPIRAVISITALHKSINQMFNNNKQSAYHLPETERAFAKQARYVDKIPQESFNVLVSKNNDKARISGRILDKGADTVQGIGTEIDTWITANTDASIVRFQRTGTGLIIDKNAVYVRESLLWGLGMAMLIVSLIMVFLFRDIRMLLISIVPNMFPLLLGGAFLGFAGIELEAGVSIVFAVIFGIAVDDTIHFLSKFKLARDKGKTIEEAIHITFLETGKAICLTSVILFFGFLVMLFSIHPPSVTIGLLISLTLFSALFSDLLLIPLLIRWLMKEK